RKAHLLGDKQIPSVGVFDEVTWKTFGGNTRDLGSILKETRQDCKLAQEVLKNCSQKVETASGFLTTPSGFASDNIRNLVTASKRSRPKKTLEDSASQDKEDYSTSARSIRYCFDHNSFIRTRILTIQQPTRSQRENPQLTEK
ncbi:hypothetical protein Tco_1349407, partial [Tanacetum coccineum]